MKNSSLCRHTAALLKCFRKHIYLNNVLKYEVYLNISKILNKFIIKGYTRVRG